MTRHPVKADPLHLAPMLLLTFSTGVIDAVGYLGLDRVFTGNMTGNVVLLGMAFTEETSLPVLRPSLALGGFLVGAALGGRVLRGSAEGWNRRTTGLLVGVAVALAALTGVLAVTGDAPPDPEGVIVTTVMAIAMGVQAAAARRLAVKDITTVVVTSTITGIAADSHLGGGRSELWRRRGGAIVLIMAGAAAGAALLRWHIAPALALSVLVTVVAVVLGAVRERRAQRAAAAAAAVSA